jgi:hypothetical protein
MPVWLAMAELMPISSPRKFTRAPPEALDRLVDIPFDIQRIVAQDIYLAALGADYPRGYRKSEFKRVADSQDPGAYAAGIAVAETHCRQPGAGFKKFYFQYS